MREVVINDNWGGFGLDKSDLEYMAKIGSKKAGRILKKTRHGIHDYNRSDPYLVQAVKDKKINKDLIIKKIKSDKYFITDYDGIETLHTPENIKWLKV